jgi:hypothetical protein
MDPQKLMGFVTHDDEKVPVSVRDWDGMKRAIWRSKEAWSRVQREVIGVLERCSHMEGCEGKTSETAPCLPDCPDREMRMSALVILNESRAFDSVDVRRPANASYFAPSREYFSAVLADLSACQLELEALRTGTVNEPPQLQEKTT